MRRSIAQKIVGILGDDVVDVVRCSPRGAMSGSGRNQGIPIPERFAIAGGGIITILPDNITTPECCGSIKDYMGKKQCFGPIQNENCNSGCIISLRANVLLRISRLNQDRGVEYNDTQTSSLGRKCVFSRRGMLKCTPKTPACIAVFVLDFAETLLTSVVRAYHRATRPVLCWS